MAAKKLSASSAQRFMACPGSANLDQAIPGWTPPVEDPLKFRAKGVGTQIHELLELYVNLSPNMLSTLSQFIGAFSVLPKKERVLLCQDIGAMTIWLSKQSLMKFNSSFGHRLIIWFQSLEPYPPKMLRYLQETAEQVGRLFARYQYQTLVERWSELQLDTTWLIRPGTTTADLVVWDPDSGVLEIVDYKTGSIEVSAYDNDQLLFYAKSVLHWLFTTKYPSVLPGTIKINMHIMQPGFFSEATVTDKELNDWAKQALIAEEKMIQGATTLKPGDHCTFCPANPYARGERGYPMCPAQREVLFPSTIDLDEILS